MKRLFSLSFLIGCLQLSAQDLDWNTVTYTTGSLSTNFGSIGSPASNVSLNITGNSNRIDAGFPVKYAANPPGILNDCAVNCALRSSVTFATIIETIIYTFTFSSAVTTLSFSLYDIDGNNTSGDRANVTASGPSGASTITMVNINTPASTITGSGTTSATVTGTQGNTTDHITNVTIAGSINTLIITYSNNPANPAAGNRSFSIGNMDWLGVLPVKWLSFSGTVQSSGTVLLKWSVTEERNVSRYIVQRSENSRDFSSIGTVLYSSVTGTNNQYTFTDQIALPGNSYYRILQVDHGGSENFSSTLLIRSANKGPDQLMVYPNPAHDEIFINANNVQLSIAEIFDIKGRLVYMKNNTNNRLDIGKLLPGNYLLRITDDKGVQMKTSFFKY